MKIKISQFPLELRLDY